MSATPLISINLCCYNSENYVRQTIDSILAQTYPHWELVVINDGSKDSTEEILNTYAASDERIHIHSQENQGLARSRNNGISYSHGEFIAFIDHDDWWDATMLEKQVKASCKNPAAALVYTDCMYVDTDGTPQRKGSNVEQPHSGRVFRQLVLVDFIPLSAALVRREVLEEVGRFNESFGIIEDYDIFLKVAEKYPVEYVDEVLMYYRVHLSNNSKNFNKLFTELQMMYQTWLDRLDPDDPDRRAIDDAVAISRVNFGRSLILREHRITEGAGVLAKLFLKQPSAIITTLKYFLDRGKRKLSR